METNAEKTDLLLEQLGRTELKLFALQDELDEVRAQLRACDREHQEHWEEARGAGEELARIRSSVWAGLILLLLRWEERAPRLIRGLTAPLRLLWGGGTAAEREAREDAVARCLASGYLDPAWYLMRNPELARLGVRPAEHWVVSGWREGRDPGPDFQVEDYLARHPQCREENRNPLLHFLDNAEAVGKGGSPS